MCTATAHLIAACLSWENLASETRIYLRTMSACLLK